MSKANWSRNRWKFGELSEHQIRFAKARLAEGKSLRAVAASIDATTAELDLALWRSLGRDPA